MSMNTGSTITCDRHECRATAFGSSEVQARINAGAMGWTHTDDGRDFCGWCSDIRAKRKKLSEIAPAGVRLMRVFDAAEAAGWERRDYDEATGVAHFFCCGVEVETNALLGSPYRAECGVCGSAIADILGPAWGKSSVSIADPDKVDTEDPCSWFVVADVAIAAATGGDQPGGER